MTRLALWLLAAGVARKGRELGGFPPPAMRGLAVLGILPSAGPTAIGIVLNPAAG